MKRGVIIIAGIVLLIIVTVLAIVLSRSKSTTSSEITLKVWSPYNEVEAWGKLSSDFKESHPNVTLEYKYVEADDAKDYEARVVNALADGNGPDVWLIRNDWLHKHQDKLVASSDYVKWSTDKKVSEKDALKQLLGESLYNQASINDRLYSRPYSVDSLALYINDDVVGEARNDYQTKDNDEAYDTLSNYPETWGDVEEWVRLLTKKSGSTISISGIALGTVDNTYASTDIFQALLAQYGGSIYSDDLKTTAFNIAKTVDGKVVYPAQQALSLYRSFSDPASTNYSWNESMGDPLTAFAQGKVAMMVGYSSTYASLRKINKSLESVRIVSLPQVNDLDLGGKPTYFAAYYTPVVTKNSNNPALAWSLLASIDESLIDEYSTLTARPSANEVDDESTSYQGADDYGDIEVFGRQATWCAKVVTPDWQTTSNTIQEMLRQVVSGQSTTTVMDNGTELFKKYVK